MLVVYASKTGNIERFISKAGIGSVFRIVTGDEIVNEPYILLTYTISFGKVPPEVDKFLQNNSKLMVGVAGSGNRNWGDSFCNAVNLIRDKYNVKEILKFELSGTQHDVDNFIGRIENETFGIE
ncbi:class Ib ribonucleoside-diphosphate reductase assembly flavoprotein NrdI (plasmid) [Borrelia miyamotoi]|uniref:class Ib ribonucleoside-diphosphate reductase assembly flavoprotein NrdI n=1 Tax=Borrelia miyamotoi TaxID=47466 RepID=UPI00087AAD8E|nr:nrdI protein [Borrelia miyamotoi]ASQ29648.1 class Ib ribonucleoside-diphosphate reductase assembly flavoprotein NrdI [Borrelia miyamotoi]QTL84126.1 class Ib ribonucleoside-diphosphate reductase assembly flavoprotein NrdI [Borrelia miyamotoi]